MSLSNCFVPRVLASSTTAPSPSAPLSPSPGALTCDVGVINGVSGSATVCLGGTRIYCSVYGPRANRNSNSGAGGTFADIGALECEVRYADRTSSSGMSADNPLEPFMPSEQRLSASLKDALEPAVRSALYPKATISVYAVVMSANGNELAALISCASLALADAFIEMEDLVCGTTIGVVKDAATCVASDSAPRRMAVDPRADDSPTLAALLTVSMMVHQDSLTHLSVEGRISDQEMFVALETARTCCQRVRSTLDQCLVRTSR